MILESCETVKLRGIRIGQALRREALTILREGGIEDPDSHGDNGDPTCYTFLWMDPAIAEQAQRRLWSSDSSLRLCMVELVEEEVEL